MRENLKKFINEKLIKDKKLQNFKLRNNGKWILENFPNVYFEILKFKNNDESFSQILFNILNDIEEISYCQCGHKVKFYNFSYAYGKFCCCRCAQKSKLTKEKIEKTNIKRYGYKNPIKNEEVYLKMKNTMLERYGVEHNMYLNSTKEKIKLTNLKNWNVENVFQNNNIKNKIKQTNLNKYGENHILKCEKYKINFREKFREKYFKRFIQLLQLKNIEICFDKEYYLKNDILKFFCKNCNTYFETIKSNPQNIHCECRKQISKYEIEILNWLKSLNIENISQNNRNLIQPYELDLFLNGYNLAIEFNGLYWHSIKFKNRFYHYKKYKLCEKNGIRLIQIFEEDWEKNKEKIKENLLNHK